MIGNIIKVEVDWPADWRQQIPKGNDIDAAAAINATQLGGIGGRAEGLLEGKQADWSKLKAIIAVAAVEHIGATTAHEGVAAVTRDKGFS